MVDFNFINCQLSTEPIIVYNRNIQVDVICKVAAAEPESRLYEIMDKIINKQPCCCCYHLRARIFRTKLADYQ